MRSQSRRAAAASRWPSSPSVRIAPRRCPTPEPPLADPITVNIILCCILLFAGANLVALPAFATMETSMDALKGKDYGKERMSYSDFTETKSGLQVRSTQSQCHIGILALPRCPACPTSRLFLCAHPEPLRPRPHPARAWRGSDATRPNPSQPRCLRSTTTSGRALAASRRRATFASSTGRA